MSKFIIVECKNEVVNIFSKSSPAEMFLNRNQLELIFTNCSVWSKLSRPGLVFLSCILTERQNGFVQSERSFSHLGSTTNSIGHTDVSRKAIGAQTIIPIQLSSTFQIVAFRSACGYKFCLSQLFRSVSDDGTLRRDGHKV